VGPGVLFGPKKKKEIGGGKRKSGEPPTQNLVSLQGWEDSEKLLYE